MSLQGPAWPRCVRRATTAKPLLRRPCIPGADGRFKCSVGLLLVLAITMVWPVSKANAHCHIFRVWHYPKPQKCFTALAPRPISRETARREASFAPERIEIILPAVEFVPCPEGDEHLRGVALLRDLMDAR